MAIHFSIVKRGQCPQTVDAVDFQSSSIRLPSLMPKGELQAALSTMQRVMLHELEKGNAVTLPGIGTFRVSLKGGIEVKDGNYHGKDVRVESIHFRPDNELLKKARRFEVEQEPFGLVFQTEEAEIESRIAKLFASKNIVTHKDVATAFEQTLTRGRISAILRRLVKEGRIVSEGKGSQTRYRRK